MNAARILWVILALAACAVGRAAASSSGDPALIALVEEPYDIYGDVPVRLAQLEEALAQKNDARAVFAAVYRLITEEAVAAINDGSFKDPDWTAAFLLVFANLYRQALLDYECGRLDEVPEAWIVAFDAARSEDVTVFQHALLGIHAHINRDFPFAIAKVTPPEDRARRYPDYLATNRFLISTIQDVEELLGTVYDENLGELDAALGTFDESLLRIVLSRWRLRAWQTAALFDGNEPEWVQRFAAAWLDRTTGRAARSIRGSRKMVTVPVFPKVSQLTVRRECQGPQQ